MDNEGKSELCLNQPPTGLVQSTGAEQKGTIYITVRPVVTANFKEGNTAIDAPMAPVNVYILTLPEGMHHITVSAEGYYEQTAVQWSQANQPHFLDITLQQITRQITITNSQKYTIEVSDINPPRTKYYKGADPSIVLQVAYGHMLYLYTNPNCEKVYLPVMNDMAIDWPPSNPAEE